ncbi:hypothetical protein AADZ86_06425 [Colwelliaceae bacterium BS250]
MLASLHQHFSEEPPQVTFTQALFALHKGQIVGSIVVGILLTSSYPLNIKY